VRVPLLLVGSFVTAGLGAHGVCHDLADRLSAGGWPVLTTSSKSGRLQRLLDMIGSVWRHRHAYAVAQVDVYSGPAFLWAEMVCWTLHRAQKPHVLTLHGGNLPLFARRWPGRVRRLLRGAAAVTTPSRYLQEQMRSYRDDLLLLPNPLDLAAYRFRLRQPAQPRLVWLRAFDETYNPVLAPRVLARLTDRFPNVQLTMIGRDKGDGSLQRTQRIARELGVLGRLSLPGGVPKAAVPAWLDAGDLFLNTTNVDNTPVSVIEAMASGLCIVSTKVGGIPYLLRQEQDALLVPPDDPAAMAAAVHRILVNSSLAGSLSHSARARAAGFDWSAVLPQWEALLADVAAGSTP
jgi:glycosyltransferase involved in cell wall biosynthesis